MATYTWAATSGGTWGTSGNWSPAGIPGSTDTADITNPGTYTVQTDANADAIDTLVLSDANATLSVNTGLSVGTSLSVTAGTLALTDPGYIYGAGNILIDAGATLTALSNMGSIAVTGTVSIAGAAVVNAGDTLYVSNTVIDTGSMTMNGGRLSVDGTFNGTGGTLTIENGGRAGFGGSVVGSDTIIFGAGDNTLNIAGAEGQTTTVAPPIVGFVAGDVIEMSSANPNSTNQPTFNAATGQLSYTDGSGTWNFTLEGVAAGTTFEAVQDTTPGFGGVDIIVAGSSSVPAPPAGEDLLLQNSNGQLALWQVSGTALSASGMVGPNPGTSWLAMGTGSFFSGDTDDVLWQNQDGTVAVWQVQGTSLGTYGVVSNPGTAWQIVGTGDFYGAGSNNAVVLQNDNGAVALWELNGDSIEQYGYAQYQGAAANPGPAWQVVATGTLYGGSQADIVLQNANGAVAIWQMSGNTIETAVLAQYQGVAANPGTAWQVKGTGDYFGNGDSDIVLQNANGQVAIWEMNGGTIEQAAMVQYQGATANPGSDWQVVGTGALSNGGISDIVLQNSNGAVGVWEMSGATITQASVVANPGTSWGVIDGTMRFIYAGAAGETLAAAPPAPDEFVFDSFAAGTHTISGFDPVRDLIAFSSSEFGSYAAVQAATSAVAGGSMINLGAGSTLLLPGVDPTALHASNFVLT